MLPRRFRLRKQTLIQATVRRGSYSRGRLVAVHYLARGTNEAEPQVALAVSRRVGNAVARNQVSRRIRHLMAARVDRIPAGGCLVVRALPAAGDAPSRLLAADLDRLLTSISTAGKGA